MALYKLWMAIFFSAIINCFSTSAQGIQISKYIATAFNDDQLKPQKEKVDFLKSSSANTPLFNEVELRTRTNRFELARQRYSVRLSPNGFGEAKQGKKVYDATLQYNRLQYQVELNDAIRRRYDHLLSLIFLLREYELEKKMAQIYSDRLTVLKKHVTTLDFKFNNLVDAEDRDIDLQLDIINLENDIAALKNEMSKFYPVDPASMVDTSGLISLETIVKKVRALDTLVNPDNIHLNVFKKEVEMDEARLSLEKAENRQYISYLEARYDAADSKNFERAFSTGIGVRIPIVNPNRLDINRRKLAAIRSKTDYLNKKRRLSENTVILARELMRSMKQFEVLMEKKKNSKAEASFRHFNQVEGVDPLILLKLKESVVKTDMAIEKAKYRVYTRYIRLIDAHGKLGTKPYVNHLSQNGEALKR